VVRAARLTLAWAISLGLAMIVVACGSHRPPDGTTRLSLRSASAPLRTAAAQRPKHRAEREPASGGPLNTAPASFAALRRRRRLSDLLPAAAQVDAAKIPRNLTEGSALSMSSARRVLRSHSSAWMLTNAGGRTVCLIQRLPVLGHPPGTNVSCLPLASALDGQLVLTVTGAPGETGTEVVGVVPDGVSKIAATASGGSQRLTFGVAANAYSFSLLRPEEVTFARRTRRFRVTLPQPPEEPLR
jgi:hypothetical protein